MRLVFAIVFFYLLFAIYVMAHASGQITVRMTPDPKGHIDHDVELISVMTNDDNSTTINIYACGSMIELVVDEDLMRAQSPRIEKVASHAIGQACKKASQTSL